MFRFENINHLYALLVLPVLLLVFFFYKRWRRKTLNQIAEQKLIPALMPEISNGKVNWRFWLMFLALFVLIIAWANPQFGTRLEEVKRKGADIIIALDVSNSMLATDFTPNRLESAKQAISKLINSLHDDRIGIIVFAGQSYVQLPVTTDYASAKLFLNSISADMIPVQGTAIGNAIDLAVESFDKKSTTAKSVIIITDGENHEDDAVKSAENAKTSGIIVHTIGIGSEQGVPLPNIMNGKVSGYRKDEEGNTVVSKLNASLLQEIAAAGKGIYVHADKSQSALMLIKDEIDQMEKKEYASKKYTDFEGRFQFFIAAALMFLLMETLLSEHKSHWLDFFRISDKQALKDKV